MNKYTGTMVTACVCALLGWTTGMDFTERGSNLFLFAVFTLWACVMAYTYPIYKKGGDV